MIYFISDGEFVKVGTAKDVEARLSTIRGANARTIEVLAICEGGHDLERKIHKALPDRVRNNGEWFRKSATIMGLIGKVQADGVEAAKAFVRRANEAKQKADWTEFEMAYDAAAQAVLTIICAKHGSKRVAELADVTEASVRLYLSGKVRPGALTLARLGLLEPQLINLLFPAASPSGRIAA